MTTPDRPRKLGRKHAKNAPALRLRSILAGVPDHPKLADRLTGISSWGLWANDRFGTCGPVSFFNYLKLVTHHLGGVEAQPTLDDVFGLYRLCNPSFDPQTGQGDDGVDMQTMLELAKAHDVLGGGRLVAFARVDLTDIPEVRAAISIFGGLLLGVGLTAAQDRQTDERPPLWDYVRRSPTWGGHAVLAGMYDSDIRPGHSDVEIITWGRRVGTTHAFQIHQLDEAWVVILKEHLDHPGFQAGINTTALEDAYTALTGDSFPVPLPRPPESPDDRFGRFLSGLPAAWDEFRQRP